ncbi:hypothetical protein F0L68_37175 [Solihabitans fulvus]|uniref:Carbon monoxide dehydrogenase subunit G n=1 Tax=Solihabitans fulvus TaxID=1892852 RepID=A0A5B2WLM2_9PSEU|nr:hypothetical protein [Solihabitans fulvus]KAA2251446.1 hypothetical protein F0L68_37175 [Solihabitans fulvus]
MTPNWPVADLDPVRRLAVLAEAIPGAVFAEDVLDAPFDQVWAVAGDLENALPALLTDVRSMRFVEHDGERLVAEARSHLGLRDRFDVVLRPGWCLMQSGRLIGGMAAVADGDRTRFGFLGGLRLPGTRLAGPALRRLGRPIGRRFLRRLGERVAEVTG